MVAATVRAMATIICLAAGLAFAFGGADLIWVGGSSYYLMAGIALATVAALLFLRSAWALWLYAGLTFATLGWAVEEIGFDWWQLAPRGDLIVGLGIVLALPPVVLSLNPSPARSAAWATLAASLLATVAVAGIAIFSQPHDLAGNLPTASGAGSSIAADEDWDAYGGTAAADKFSALAQLNPKTVSQLRVAWTFHTGDVRAASDPVEATYEVTPLKIGDALYLCTPHDLVFALDAETGRELWRFDPKIKQPSRQDTQHLTCRGLSYFQAPSDAAPNDCLNRLFLPTVDGRLFAISARTGKPCPGFGGSEGFVDLWHNMPNVVKGSYYSTSPPVVAGRLVIVGGAVNDNVSTVETSGVIRAYDAQTGELAWNWDSLNPQETKPIAAAARYSANSPNSWSASSYDADLGLVYVPMGNQPPDQFGGGRDKNAETYSASIIALSAKTGALAWVYQTTHHDLWDMDVPAQPELVDLTIAGQKVPALVAATKQGELFVLDRRTGKPALGVTETPAPSSAAEGDFASPTQPVSVLSFNPAPLNEASMWGLSPFDQLACRIKFHAFRYDGRYTPPSLRGSIVYPGNFGTFNWGGVAIDPDRQIAFAMPVYLAFTSTLVKRPNATDRVVTQPGEPPFNENFGAPYAVKMGAFLSPLGLPCQAPPWGYVAGADLTTGKIAYRHINGTVRDLSPLPLPFKLGVPGIGGPLLTRGGLAFLSGSLDDYVRAYDVTNGEVLWEARLPAGGQASPMTYWSQASERQFLVVVAGGHGSTGTKAGDAIIAYALPKN